jgi:dihydropteroate synthase
MQAATVEKRDSLLRAIGSRPVVMGILNVTPDSFSDGGKFLRVDEAARHAQRMAGEGCDIVDVGAESTRPEAVPVPLAEELRRIEPILAQLVQTIATPISVDTYKAAVARRACTIGAAVVNDIWGLQGDLAMADTVAECESAVIVMHNRHHKDDNIDIVDDMIGYFDRSLALAARAGILEERIILDPGVGFGKTARQHIEAIAAIGRLKSHFGRPILIGVSRKSFLGSLLKVDIGNRLIGTLAANLAAAAAGADAFRVHDVAEHVAALKVFSIICKPNFSR